MAVQILYPDSPDAGFLDWQVNSGTINRYDAINEGTTSPDIADYVTRSIVGDVYFDDVYESGTALNTIKAYYQKVRVNLGEMNVWPGSGNIELNLYAANKTIEYYGSPSWGVGSFYSQHDYLIDYWKLGETTGVRATSVSGGMSLSPYFSPEEPSYATGKQSNAAVFDGDSYLYSSISTVNNPTYRFDAGKSFGGWVYNQTSGDATIFTLGNTSPRTSCCTLRLLDGGTMEFAIYRNITDATTGEVYGQKIKGVSVTAPEQDTWSFIVCVFDIINRKIKISINGEAFTEETFSNYKVNNNFYDFYLGGNPSVSYTGAATGQSVTASYFTGMLDEWAIWDKDLTLSEISNIYNSGDGQTYPLDDIIEKKYTTLYDNNGLEIASISPSVTSGSGDLIPVNTNTPTLYSFELDDISEQGEWNEYDLTNTYIDLQFFTEVKNTVITFNSTGLESANTETNVSTGGRTWVTLDETHTIDSTYTTTGSAIAGTTDTLYLSNFGFSVPDNTITGVDIQIVARYYKAPSTTSVSFSMWLTDDTGTIISDEITSYTPTENIIGSPPYVTDNITFNTLGTWGASLTPAIVNSSGFGVKIVVTTTTSGSVGNDFEMAIDYIGLNVRYAASSAGATSLHSTIFAMDIDLDGQVLSGGTVPLYMCNKLVPQETTLYTAALLPSGETPLHIWGNDVEPTGIPLHTIGGIYENASTDLYLLNTLTPADTTLYIQGKDSDSGLVPLNMFGKASDTGSHPLFIHGAFSDDAEFNLFIEGYGGDVSADTALFLWSTEGSGLRDIASLFMKSDNSGYSDGDMNLYIQSPDSADITSNLPLYINSATPSEGNNTTLFIQQNNTESSGNIPLFISSPGTTPGALPYNTDIPLFIAREQNFNWLSTSMYMHVASGEDATTTMFIKSVNNTNDDTTMFIQSKDDTSGEQPLYISGF